MSELYEVYSENENLPAASDLSEQEAYDLNQRLMTGDSLYKDIFSSNTSYRANPFDDDKQILIEELELDAVPVKLSAVRKRLNELYGDDRRILSAKIKEILPTHASYVGELNKILASNLAQSIQGEYEGRFDFVINDGTIESVISYRVSDFDNYLDLAESIEYSSLNDKDRAYVDNILFMLEAFRNIADNAGNDLDEKFYKTLAIFDKKIISAIFEAVNYTQVSQKGSDELELDNRNFTRVVGTHYNVPMFKTLYAMSKYNARNFARWLSAESTRSIGDCKDVVDFFEKALDRAGDIDVGQGNLKGSQLFTGCSEQYQANEATAELTNAAILCCLGGAKVKTALDLTDPNQTQLVYKILASASISALEGEGFTSIVGVINQLSYAFSNISTEQTYRMTRAERGGADIRTRNPIPMNRFTAAVEKAKSGVDILNAADRNLIAAIPMLAKDVVKYYCNVNFSKVELQSILSEEDNPDLKNMTYFRWMALMYQMSSQWRTWGANSIDQPLSERLLSDKELSNNLSGMIYFIRGERERGNDAFEYILGDRSPSSNPFLGQMEDGFNYYTFDESARSGASLDSEFVEAMRVSEYADEFDILFPEATYTIPCAMHSAFIGAILSPHKNWNDISNYKCRKLEHGNPEWPSIEIYQTSQFNPICLVTGHNDLSDCCMYARGAGSGTAFADFFHTPGVSTLFVFDTKAPNKGNMAYYNRKGDVICLGTVFNAKTYVTLKDANLVSDTRKLQMIEGDTKLYLQYNEPVPYTVDSQGSIKEPLSSLDRWERQKNNALSSELKYDYNDVAKNLILSAIGSDPELNYLIAGVDSFDCSDLSSHVTSSSKMGVSYRCNDSLYTDGRQSYEDVRTGLLGSMQVSNASSTFSVMLVSFDNEGDNVVVGYLDHDNNEVPQVEVSWDYLRYMFSFPMGNAFVPFEGCVCFDTSAKNKAVCMELLTPAWFASADEKPLVRGENEYTQADLIEMRTPKGGAFLGKTQIL
jgi:hypothetical protein